MLTGPRQVGKTTLCERLGSRGTPPRTLVSLDEFGPRNLALEDPSLFFSSYPPPLTVDEIQHAPGLLSALKPVVDRAKTMGGYWITGSQPLALMRSVSESLAGRVAVVDLLGLSQAEEQGATSAPGPFRPDRVSRSSRGIRWDLISLFERIVRGSFPRLAHPDAPPMQSFYGSYVQTYIERDIRSLLNISNLATFQRFIRIAASRVGQLLNYSDIGRDAGVSVSTAKEWLHLLEATGQIFLLRPYFENIGKRQIKTPKLYFSDTGLVCYLAGWRSAQTASAGAMAGALLENYCVSEIIKSYRHRGQEAPVWFYRNKEKQEVDLIIAEDGLLFPVEVKLTASPQRKHLTGIRALESTRAELGKGALLCLVDEPVPLDERTDAVPVGCIA
ncbi:MAG: ATP-binding protein [Deltaproteobacteria bacterium]|nr:ATP-binding protein [Deltaproteobacteria bacterium]